MTAIDYLSEDGTGTYGRWHVPDLVPSNRTVELVFVFESPHVDELRDRLPVAGAAGKSALRFLMSDQPRDLSLGRFVQQSHVAGDQRIAILNVSNVPMQAAAFVDVGAPELEEGEWALIERVRRSRSRSISSMRGAGTRAISDFSLTDSANGSLVSSLVSMAEWWLQALWRNAWLLPLFPI